MKTPIEQSPQKYVVAALYKFAPLTDLENIQSRLQSICDLQGIKGTLLIAAEGINGTIAGTRSAIDSILTEIRALPHLADLVHKESSATNMPFYRMKVRLKKEIVTMGIPAVDPNKAVGTYVKPAAWNALLQDPEVFLIDTRNDYEVRIGAFSGALNPQTKTFREFPEYVRQNFNPEKHKKIAMYCTGGIRCEKASSFMKLEGFEEVYHLEGGILKYLEEVPANQSLWDGECFVFDQRVSIKHGLEEGAYDLCFGCREPLSDADKISAQYVEGVTCPHCHDTAPEKTRRRAQERQHQIMLAKKRQQPHLGS